MVVAVTACYYLLCLYIQINFSRRTLMKYPVCTTVFVLFFLSTFLFAKVITVDNRPGAQYQSLSKAISATQEGDTVLVNGSELVYDNINITKSRVTVIGPGYFLDENSGYQANLNPAKVGQVTFSTNAVGSVVQGLYITKGVSMSGKKCILERNYVSGSTSGGGGLRVEGQQDSCIIRQNFINTTSSFLTLSGGTNTVYIYNNYIHASSMTVVATGGEIYNNVIRNSVSIENITYNNNIQITGTFSTPNVIPYNNIGNSTQYGTSNGNQSDVNMDNVFTSDSMSTDDQYQLDPEGDAIGAGFGGVNCGMFDDSFGHKYILSGIPPIPSIYEFTKDDALENVTIKVRSNL